MRRDRMWLVAGALGCGLLVMGAKAAWAEQGEGHAGVPQEVTGPPEGLPQHPEAKREMMRERWQQATPEQREEFMKGHPGAAHDMAHERWEHATPEERGRFLQEHPRAAGEMKDRKREQVTERMGHRGERAGQPRERFEHRGEQREQMNRGVRDHGQGQGRAGVGQGAEHRSPKAHHPVQHQGGGARHAAPSRGGGGGGRR